VTFYFLCKTTEVSEGELRSFIIKETEILVVKHVGQIYCLQARCTHAGAPLADGELIGDILQCPWHGSRFDIRNGSVIRGPAEKQLHTYNCILEEERLLVEL
jgi:nitrite reductase/ring-hydroxylating ferredoxin subunit